VRKSDFKIKVLEQLEQAELLSHGVAIRPRKPTILARINNKAVFGLPGHVASAMVVFYLVVRPLLLQLSGKTGTRQLLSVEATTAEQIPSAIGREEYVRVRLQWSNPDKPPTAIPMYGKSGLLSPLVKADGLMVIDRDSEGMDLGQPGKVLLFPSLQ
jgi:molybdopterin molybdotransferase